MRDDMTLQRAVLDELQWEPSVDAAEIGVTASDGVVTLKGRVLTFSEKVVAERAAKRVSGVRGVANDIEVRVREPHERNDTDIAQNAVVALKWRTFLPDDRITVTVSEGRVTLDGDVDWHYQKVSAEEAVRPLLGVKDVLNRIAVKPRASAKDVKTRIEDAFRRSAELDAQKIQVETHDGKVILRGHVRNWSEREEAQRTAWSAPGVSHVENDLGVTP